jgi:ABC-type sugar transport system substrate-binding protein
MRVNKKLQEICDANGVKLNVVAAQGDVNQQVQQVENFITMDVDALIILPVDPKVLGPVMKQAKDAGIYVVNSDQLADPEDFNAALSVDMYDLGVQCNMIASAWIDKTFPDAPDGSVKVAVFGFGATEQFKMRGDAMMTIADLNKKCTVVQYYDTTVNTYQQDVPNNAAILLQQHPDINVILSFTDTFALLVQGVLDQNKSTLDFSKIGQFTIDSSVAGFNAIKASQTNESAIRGTIVAGLDIYTELFQLATQAMDKSRFNEDNIAYGVLTPVTSDNIDDYMYVVQE